MWETREQRRLNKAGSQIYLRDAQARVHYIIRSGPNSSLCTVHDGCLTLTISLQRCANIHPDRRRFSLNPMPHRRRLQSPVSLLTLLLASLFSVSSAQDDCHPVVSGTKFDFSSISGEHSVSWTRSTPPTTMQDSLRFNVCEELQPLDGIDKADQVCTVLAVCSACVPHARGARRTVSIWHACMSHNSEPEVGRVRSYCRRHTDGTERGARGRV